ncbi:ABC-type multidrug transport system fused ATPase/permease subunit [Paraburkholderia sp. WSM4175]
MFGRRSAHATDSFAANSDELQPSQAATGSAAVRAATDPGGIAEATSASLTVATALSAANRQGAPIRSETFRTIRAAVFSSMNMSAALMMSRSDVRAGIEQITGETIVRDRLTLTLAEQTSIVDEILNDMFGIGPIEPLLADERVTDILVNGPDQVYVERGGRLELTALKFRDNAHVINVAQRIATAVGRRVDESSPMVDARLADGSRVNVVLPPIALRGASISIRKFSKRNITLGRMSQQGNISAAMVDVLRIATACRLNIVISGGTGSGKTTLLNALSRFIDEERAHCDDRGRGRTSASAAARRQPRDAAGERRGARRRLAARPRTKRAADAP